MGTFKSFDLSISGKLAGSIANNYVPDSCKNGNSSDSVGDTETIDFSNTGVDGGTETSSDDCNPSTDIYLVNDPENSFHFDEVDDFSGGQYSEATLKQYFLTYGDINGDGKITNDDASLIQEYLSSNANNNDITVVNTEFDFNFTNRLINIRIGNGIGDIDGDGEVTLKDVTLIQKYISDGKLEVTNLTMANRLDTIKYTDVQTQVNDDLEKKKTDLNNIETLSGYMDVVNSIKVTPDSFGKKISGVINSGALSINSGNEEDYLFYNSVNDNNLDLSLPEGYSETDKEALKQSLIKSLVNSTLYRKNHNTMLTPNKVNEDAVCDYVIKHAAEIVDYEIEYGSLEKAKAAYQNNISALTYSKKQLKKQVAIISYDNIMKTADFKKYANNTKVGNFNPEKNDKLKNCSKYMDSYNYLGITQLTMYNYLLETKGEDEANKYLDAYEEDINQAKGLEQANKFIGYLDKDFSKIVKEDGSLMDENDVVVAQELVNNNSYDKKYDMNDDGKLDSVDITKLSQYIDAGGEILTTFDNLDISYSVGFWDGWDKFFAGFKYISDDTAVMSADEYKMMFIAQKLEQNGVLATSYEFGQTVGNMVPTIIAAAAATLATSYFGGEGGIAVLGTTLSAQQVGQITAGSLIFMSTYGTSKHDALVKGHDLETAVGYGVLSGLSEAGLETLLGSLPYVGSECKNVLVAMFKEGLSESAQEFVGAMIGESVLGEEIDINGLSADMGKAFVFGALLSGAGYAGKSVVKVSLNGAKYVLTSSQIMDYYNKSIDPVTGENNGLTLQEYVEENVESDTDSTTNTPASSSGTSTYVDTSPIPDGADFIQEMKKYNPNAKIYTDWEEFKNSTETKRKTWESDLSKEQYVDSKTGRKYTLEDVVDGYTGESLTYPGCYALLNTVNRAKGATPTDTINNLILKDSDGNPILASDGRLQIRFYHCWGGHTDYIFDPISGNVYSDYGGGLNVDRSVGTVYDLLDRVDSESKALHQAISGLTFDQDTVLKRGAGMRALAQFGVEETDSADVIYQKLTVNGNVFVDNGFVSSSPTDGFDGKVQFIICAKEGSGYGNFADYNGGERETLLDYGNKYEINAVRKDSGGTICVFLTQI